METSKVKSSYSIVSKPNKTKLWSSMHAPSSTSKKKTEFAGFGVAAPPGKRRHSSVDSNKDKNSLLLLKDAERLIQVMLGDDTETLSAQSIAKAIQQQKTMVTSPKTKARYNAILKKPWRTTPPTSYQNGESSESCLDDRITKLEVSNPKNFRRSSLSNVADYTSTFNTTTYNPMIAPYNNNNNNMIGSSLSETTTTANNSSQQDASEMECSSTCTSYMDDNHNHADLATQLAQSQSKLKHAQEHIQALREKLSIVMMNADPTECEAMISISEEEDDDVDDFMALSNNHKNNSKQQLDELKAKVDELEKQLAEAQAKQKEATEQAEKVTTEVQALQDVEKQVDGLKINVAVANAKAEMAERKLADLEVSHDNYRADMTAKLAAAQEKTTLLHTELSNLMPLTTQMSQIRQDLHMAETKLKKSQQIASSTQAAADTATREKEELQQRFDKAQKESALRIATLEQNLLVAKNSNNNLHRSMEFSQSALSSSLDSSSDYEVMQLKKELAAVRQKLQQSEQTVEQLHETGKASAVAAAARIASLEQGLREANERGLHLERAQKNEQEILSEELRESETTIACLMDELNALKPLATELEHAEKEIAELREQLQEANKHNNDRDVDNDDKAQEIRLALQITEAELLDLQKELADMTTKRDAAEQTLHANEKNHKVELETVKSKLAEAKAHSTKLQNEYEAVKAKLEELQSSTTSITEAKRLEKLLERKDKQIQSLQAEIDEQQEQIMASRMQVEEMDQERNYNRAKMMELSSLVDIRNRSDPEKRLHDKTVQCAQVTAERDTLKQKLSVAEAMTRTLEQDNKQKKELVHKLMSRGGGGDGDAASSSTEAFIESLQNEQERTLKRTAHLSLQLAESQMKIDQLTTKLRRAAKNKPQPPPPSQSSALPSLDLSLQGTTRRGLNRRSLSTMLHGGLDRVNSALDGSVGGDDEKGTLRRWSSKISNAYSVNSSSRTFAS